MKKTAKIFAVVLALVMALSVMPVAFAAEEEQSAAEAKLAAWNENYELLLDTVLDNTNYAGWNYVDQNKKAMTSEMNTYTALAFYDDAWANYATKNVDTAKAEQILLAIIGKAEYTPEYNEYIDAVVDAVDTIDNVTGKVDDVADAIGFDFSESSEWGTALKIIGIADEVLNYAGNKKDEFAAAYVKVLSVQAANLYYIDLLNYVIENASDKGLAAAAQNLVDDMSKSLNDLYEELAASVAGDAAGMAADYLLTLAINSNVYTATADKIYGGVKAVANAIWGTSNKYDYLYNLKVAAEFQALTAAWTEAALAEDAEKALVAVDLLIKTREVGDQALYNLKKADASAIAGKIEGKIYGEVYEDVAIELASLDLIEDALYNTAEEDMVKYVRALYVYCPVSLGVSTKDNLPLIWISDGFESTVANEYGLFACVKSEYSEDFLKVAYLTDANRVTLTGTGDGKVTLVMDVLNADGTVEDWSFTDLAIANGYTVTFNTEFDETPVYTYNNGRLTTCYFNDEFVASKHEKATVQEVVDAAVEVTKEETSSFIDKILEFFRNFFENLFKNLFKF